ncbi:MAG TPA: DUF305 domain-containing protein [Actinomycetota bacterium]|nr:DUF305 domain-containing protein [Actinomycetota bacterium]
MRELLARWGRDEEAWSDLRAGALTGLLSSAYSTLFVQFLARDTGRDPLVDWMQVGTVPLRNRAIRSRPGPVGVSAGVLAHQFADFFWAVGFFGTIIPRIPRRRRTAFLLASAAPWAAATAAAEYYLALPWLQPILPMQVPYWTAMGVHLSSAAAYPLFMLFGEGDRTAGRRAAALLAASVPIMAFLDARSRSRRGLRWAIRGQEEDRRFLHMMTGHHRTGLRLAELAAERAAAPDLRALGRLMAAEHDAEIRLMADWWATWFGGEVQPLSSTERDAMPGMPLRTDVDRLARMDGRSFDHRFLELMVPHHLGAIRMSERKLSEPGDVRLRLLARNIRHSQLRQIDRMESSRWIEDDHRG